MTSTTKGSSVFGSVCLSVRLQNDSKSFGQFLMKFRADVNNSKKGTDDSILVVNWIASWIQEVLKDFLF